MQIPVSNKFEEIRNWKGEQNVPSWVKLKENLQLDNLECLGLEVGKGDVYKIKCDTSGETIGRPSLIFNMSEALLGRL